MQLNEFMADHRLPEAFKNTVDRYYQPFAELLTHQISARNGCYPFVLGINGAQGTGKSTLAAYLAAVLSVSDIRVAVLSIDDVYLTRSDRQTLADSVHPLFLTRGVPATHDIDLGKSVFDALSRSGVVAIPGFSKAEDERIPQSKWNTIDAPVDLIIFEGWCVGAIPENEGALSEPINDLERQHDADGVWRRFVNQKLESEYQSLFSKIDYLLMLKAPDFESVFRWRCEQEEKLARQSSGAHIMSAQQIKTFIQHYERLTRHMLREMPARAHTVFSLNSGHGIDSVHHNKNGVSA